jgi:diaminohydroxyphosphoribosylaminopyrimidine deaminase/5-amino-6-(5-phosphoribosylamino)uracil reductase
VTLEPCNHYGRTGPCTEAVIASGVSRVVVGCADPTPHVRGGRRKLRRAGIEVEVGVRQEAAEALIADFEKLMLRRLPYVVLKAAVTLDGKLATRNGDSKWITSEAARKEVHRMRARANAVLVGVSTALADDPELNVRLVRGPNPLRVVLDTRLRLPVKSKLARVSPERRTLVFHGPKAAVSRRRRLQRCGVELCEVPLDARGRLRLLPVLRELARRDVMRLLVEGGGRVHAAFLEQGLADRAAVFIAPRILGDAKALSLADGKPKRRMSEALELSCAEVRRFGPDILVDGRIRYR